MSEARKYRCVQAANPLDAVGKVVAWAGDVEEYDLVIPESMWNPYRHIDSVALTEFTDGTTLACVTEHTGPYSDLTPDVDFGTRWLWVERVDQGKGEA